MANHLTFINHYNFVIIFIFKVVVFHFLKAQLIILFKYLFMKAKLRNIHRLLHLSKTKIFQHNSYYPTFYSFRFIEAYFIVMCNFDFGFELKPFYFKFTFYLFPLRKAKIIYIIISIRLILTILLDQYFVCCFIIKFSLV